MYIARMPFPSAMANSLEVTYEQRQPAAKVGRQEAASPQKVARKPVALAAGGQLTGLSEVTGQALLAPNLAATAGTPRRLPAKGNNPWGQTLTRKRTHPKKERRQRPTPFARAIPTGAAPVRSMRRCWQMVYPSVV
jgi:hypothetical protein